MEDYLSLFSFSDAFVFLPPSVSGGRRTSGLVVECFDGATLDLGGRENNEDDDCSEVAEFNVWNGVMLLWIGSRKLPLVSGVGGEVGGGANNEDDDCSVRQLNLEWCDIAVGTNYLQVEITISK